MPVSLAIRRDVDEFSTRGRTDKLLDESAAGRECTFESNRTRERSIVEENCERSSRSVRVTEEVRLGSIDNALPLVRGEDHVTHALFNQQCEHVVVRGRLRQPERFRFTTEPITKVSQTPDDLRQTIAFDAEWKNRMTVCLRDRVAVSTARRGALAIGIQNFLVSVAMMTLEPRQQGRAEVKTDERIIDDVRCVTLGVNALVPIVKWRCARLRVDSSRPWVLAWWLIKMAVDYECDRHCFRQH